MNPVHPLSKNLYALKEEDKAARLHLKNGQKMAGKIGGGRRPVRHDLRARGQGVLRRPRANRRHLGDLHSRPLTVRAARGRALAEHEALRSS